MESERRSSGGSRKSVRRKPLSDLSNFNLIPAYSLRNLCSSSSAQKPSSSSSSTLFSKPPNPIPVPVPNAISKPKRNSETYNSLTNKNTKANTTNSPNSNTSVGSSNLNNHFNAPNPSGTVQQSRPSTPPIPLATKSVVAGNADDEILEPLIVYNRRWSVEKTVNREMSDAVPFSLASLVETKDKSRMIVPVENTEDILMVADMNLSNIPLRKEKDKGRVIAVPSSLEKTKGKRKPVSGASTCPPLARRTRNIRNGLSKAGDIESLKSRTDPHAKHKKKRCCASQEQKDALPQDFIDEQRSYFKEIDEFELPEEEVSYDEFQKEEKA
ncbi:unnamed protein product [Ilex paraguariensis]|uniref:Uncharacterized protein n=1 Tax=Ilex paraguariensis TaxID=185542 RepID=A0ABC8QYU8_9AQUA